MVSQERKMSHLKLYQGWVAHVWRKEDADQKIISLQSKVILVLCIICAGLMIGWMRSPSDITVHIPPDIQNGSTFKVGSIPSSLIYSFTYDVWQEINSWPTDGEQDYKKNIDTFWAYLSPEFKSELLGNYNEQKSLGQLQRIRYVQGVSGSAYDVSNVQKTGEDTWTVNIKMHLVEYNNDQVVKKVDVLYPLKVMRVNMATSINPYGLVISGYASEPKRLDSTV
jgi:integrating conjugative element protein (TIGR03746 family)